MRAWMVAATLGLGLLGDRGVQAGGNTLIGWATMPVDTFADGPTTGHFARSQFGHTLPIEISADSSPFPLLRKRWE